MNLQQLRYFIAAAEQGSFTAAANSLRLAPPSVSEPIRRLEDELGLPLFSREKRRLLLTDAGNVLMARARHVVRVMDETSQTMGDLRDLRGGTARFGVFRNADYYGIELIAGEFLSSYPGMYLRLFGQNSAEVADAVRSGTAEAGLVVLPVINDDHLTIRPLLRDEVLFVSAAHSSEAPMTLPQLCSQPLVLYDAHYAASDPTRRQLTERLQSDALTLNVVLEVERVEGALRCVRAGLGDSIASGTVLQTAAPDLYVRNLEPPLYDTIAVVMRRGARLAPAARAFLEIAERRLATLAADSPTAELMIR